MHFEVSGLVVELDKKTHFCSTRYCTGDFIATDASVSIRQVGTDLP